MRHERPGIKYLLSPDIITKNDSQGWEIKFMKSIILYCQPATYGKRH